AYLSTDVSGITKQMEGVSKRLMGNLDTSWVGKIVRDYPMWKGITPSRPPSNSDAAMVPTVDFDSIEFPTASVAQVALAAEQEANEIRVEQRDFLAALLDQARTDSA